MEQGTLVDHFATEARDVAAEDARTNFPVYVPTG